MPVPDNSYPVVITVSRSVFEDMKRRGANIHLTGINEMPSMRGGHDATVYWWWDDANDFMEAVSG